MAWKDVRQRDTEHLRPCLDPEKGGGCGWGWSSYGEIRCQRGLRRRQKVECPVLPV